jgi:1-aminocyclopropane-1-carboxylate deaminase/D-cysteine desulfhydrase-like pyridoxal-dependent ACC family enzyme
MSSENSPGDARPGATPILEYSVSDRIIFVKREDLFGIHPAPPLGKLRGLEVLLSEYHAEGVTIVGCWDTRVSKLGQGLAALVRNFPGMRAIVSYPTRYGFAVPEAVDIAASLGAEILPVRGNHVSICYSQVRKRVTARGGKMLPFGLECEQAVHAIADEAATLPAKFVASATFILSCGSGVTVAGLVKGLRATPRRIVGISSGRSLGKIRACICRYVGMFPKFVELRPAAFPYYVALEYPCPFPSHPNYDLKAWKFAIDNLPTLHDPVVFWNIGA